MINIFLQVYGGGHFKINSAVTIENSHLVAVYSGGLINLDGAGYAELDTSHKGHGKGEKVKYSYTSSVYSGQQMEDTD